MYMKHGKVQFGYKDTFSLDRTLRPIIAAALEKFVEVTKHHPMRHIPTCFIEDVLGRSVEYKPNEDGFVVRDVDEDLMEELWWECVDKMIYAFKEDEPNILYYAFETGFSSKGITSTNPKESERYHKDVNIHYNKVQEGSELFGKYLSTLWW